MMYSPVERYCIEHREQFYRLAYSYVRNRDDALDVVSDAVVRALEGAEKLRNPAAIKTWCYRTVVTAALDFLRKRRFFEGEEAMAELAAPEKLPDLDLAQAVEHLTEPDHSIIVLHFYEDMKIGDVARVLELPEGTVKTRLYGALGKLRAAMRQKEE